MIDHEPNIWKPMPPSNYLMRGGQVSCESVPTRLGHAGGNDNVLFHASVSPGKV